MAEAVLGRMTLDSWAILAWLQGEPAGVLVGELIAWREGDKKRGEAIRHRFPNLRKPPLLFLNVINLGEVFYIIGRRKGRKEAGRVVQQIRLAPVTIVEASERLVFDAAGIKMRYPVAYADAFAVATAKVARSALLTGDPELKEIADVEIIWIGNEKRNRRKNSTL
ncbi:MAG TPA: type II toxin-antitoxin system VapC family toxin [Desulfotomaculum sp.]|nr:type II toxin-antitoxin system VapC family toxin [Desulfotomaculum sp.]